VVRDADRVSSPAPAVAAAAAVALLVVCLQGKQVAALGVVVQFSRAAPRSSAIVTDVQILAKEAAALDASHVVVPAVVAARDRQKIAVQIHSPPNFNTTP